MGIRSRKPVPAPPAQPEDLLGLLGAVPHGEIGLPREGECFVYGLDRADGTCFYIGKSESPYTRWGTWLTTYGDYLAGIRVLRCKNRDDMEVTELFLIERMQPEMNVNGTENEGRRRKVRARQAPKPGRRRVYDAVLDDSDEQVS
jgi:hypothetical protein